MRWMLVAAVCEGFTIPSALAQERPLVAEAPPEIAQQLPPGYAVLSTKRISFGIGRAFYLVGLRSLQETDPSGVIAPPRPLLIYSRGSDGRYTLLGRNDHLILRANEGFQCDPFEGIAAKGRFFTIENGVSCGAHWTDYITFRFDDRVHGFVFDNWRAQSWSFNPSNDPDAQALVSNGQQIVRAGRRIVLFSQWRRPPVR